MPAPATPKQARTPIQQRSRPASESPAFRSAGKRAGSSAVLGADGRAGSFFGYRQPELGTPKRQTAPRTPASARRPATSPSPSRSSHLEFPGPRIRRLAKLFDGSVCHESSSNEIAVLGAAGSKVSYCVSRVVEVDAGAGELCAAIKSNEESGSSRVMLKDTWKAIVGACPAEPAQRDFVLETFKTLVESGVRSCRSATHHVRVRAMAGPAGGGPARLALLPLGAKDDGAEFEGGLIAEKWRQSASEIYDDQHAAARVKELRRALQRFRDEMKLIEVLLEVSVSAGSNTRHLIYMIDVAGDGTVALAPSTPGRSASARRSSLRSLRPAAGLAAERFFRALCSGAQREMASSSFSPLQGLLRSFVNTLSSRPQLDVLLLLGTDPDLDRDVLGWVGAPAPGPRPAAPASPVPPTPCFEDAAFGCTPSTCRSDLVEAPQSTAQRSERPREGAAGEEEGEGEGPRQQLMPRITEEAADAEAATPARGRASSAPPRTPEAPPSEGEEEEEEARAEAEGGTPARPAKRARRGRGLPDALPASQAAASRARERRAVHRFAPSFESDRPRPASPGRRRKAPASRRAAVSVEEMRGELLACEAGVAPGALPPGWAAAAPAWRARAGAARTEDGLLALLAELARGVVGRLGLNPRALRPLTHPPRGAAGRAHRARGAALREACARLLDAIWIALPSAPTPRRAAAAAAPSEESP
eukprot:tig00020904_g15241.t1